MKSAFLTETNYSGFLPPDHPNARTEIAWQLTLNSYHYNIFQFEQVKGYDAVFVILPKGLTRLNSVGLELQLNLPDKDMAIYALPIIETLKKNNKKVCYIQEGPNWFFNDYTLNNQFHFYNQLAQCDVIFAHNKSDRLFYQGMFPSVKVSNIPTLMVDSLVRHVSPTKESKIMIGGNFCRWYGGFQSYIIADVFQNCEKWTQNSHCQQPGEEQIPDLKHLPRLIWKDWMTTLATFKYAVHLMPTVAAGTFSLNCAYFGIPCIGNRDVDTQLTFFPDLSVDVNNIYDARNLAEIIYTNPTVCDSISKQAMNLCRASYHCDTKKWLNHIESVIEI